MRLLALRGQELRERATLHLRLKVARAATAHAQSPSEATGGLLTTPCSLCTSSVPLLTSQAVPLGLDLSCGTCGCPLTIEFGRFSQIRAVEFCQGDELQGANVPSCGSQITAINDDAKEGFLAAAREQLVLLSTSASENERSPGPAEFRPPVICPTLSSMQPRESLLWRSNKSLEGTYGFRVMRLLEASDGGAESASAPSSRSPEPAAAAVDMLVACSKCGHLFIEPPAHKQLLPGDPCICCGALGSRTTILPCAPLR